MEALNMNKFAFRQSADTLDIYLYDDIEADKYDWWTGQTIISDTSSKTIAKLIEENGNVSKINLHINSNGGDVKEGIGIYSQLARHKAYKTAYIDGFAASIASVIAMACDKIVMSAVSLMFLHHASRGIYGNSEELRKAADDLDVIDASSNTAYKEHAGDKLSDEKLKELLDNSTWLSAEQCLELGLCDEVETKTVENQKTVAQQLFNNYQQHQLNQMTKNQKTVIQQMAEKFKKST